jgi:hypothetical protein
MFLWSVSFFFFQYEYKLEQWNFKLKVRGDALRQVYIRSLQPANVEEYAAMTNDAAAARLQRLTELETATGILLLATIFEKGKLFLACRRRWETQGELWQTNCEEILGLSPRQALRYIEFSQLVLALPGGCFAESIGAPLTFFLQACWRSMSGSAR